VTGRALTTLVVLAAALALAGPVFAGSPSAWAKAADAICKKSNKEIDKVAEPTSKKEFLEATGRVLEIAKRVVKDVARLPRPSRDAETIATLLGYVDKQFAVVERLVSAVKKGDSSAMEQLLAEGDRIDGVVKKLRKRLGLKECGQ
jgi:hypothetical protein